MAPRPILFYGRLLAAMARNGRDDDENFLVLPKVCEMFDDQDFGDIEPLEEFCNGEKWDLAMKFIKKKYAAKYPEDMNMEEALGEKDEDEDRLNRADLHRTQAAWKQPFYGGAVNLLQDVVAQLDRDFATGGAAYYAKTMAICQSSGAGKSKTLDEYSKRVVGVVYTFRVGDQLGYPPGDEEITNLVLEGIKPPSEGHRIYEHGMAIGLIAATIEMVMDAFRDFMKTEKADINGFSELFHSQMAPEFKDPESGSKAQIASRISTTRSQIRKDRCLQVVSRTKEILHEFKNDEKWVGIFKPDQQRNAPMYDQMYKHHLYKKFLYQPADEVSKALPRSKDGYPSIFIALDEVANINDASPVFLTALHRVIRGLRGLPFWVFLLSTKRPVKEIVPRVSLDPSARGRRKELIRAPPYYSFSLDLPMYEIMANATSARAEIEKPLHLFSTVPHLSSRGRALWTMYNHTTPENSMDVEDIRDYVMEKLLCGPKFNEDNYDHVFSVLCARIDLDPSLSGLESATYQEEAVNNRLRWVSAFDTETGTFRSRTVPEPLVSEAAASLFGNPNVDRWPKILQGFLDRACTQGMMEKGTMGELVARIIVIMARDAVFRQGKQGDVLRASDYEEVGHLGHARPFLVTAFLRELLTEAEMVLGTPALIAQKIPSKGHKDGALHGPLVSSRPAMSVRSQGSAPIPKPDTSGHHSASQQPGANIVPATIQTVLKGAVMNFNSFVDTNVELEPENVSDLCHHLLCGQAALQCSHDQPVIDIMIPIYCGDIHQNFDPQQTGALVIQVKNKLKKSPLDVAKRRDFYSSNFGANDMPLIVLTMDLSCPPLKDGTIAQRAPSFHENVFAFHLTGHTQATYKCVPDSAGHVLTKILNSEHKEEELQAACSRENLLFDRHSWASRYANVGRSSARLLKASEKGPLKRVAHEDPEDEMLIKKEKLGI